MRYVWLPQKPETAFCNRRVQVARLRRTKAAILLRLGLKLHHRLRLKFGGGGKSVIFWEKLNAYRYYVCDTCA